MKEGAAINKSLSALGNCISALAEKGGGEEARAVPRDSALTLLLKESLGGERENGHDRGVIARGGELRRGP